MRGSTAKRLVREEAGFTLPEMLVTIIIMIVVLFALYSIFDMSIRVFSLGNDKVEATQNARLGLRRMEREIRAAYPVDRINGQQHVFFVPGFPLTPDRPEEQTITFGNDLSSAGAPANRMIDSGEEITYELRHRDGGPCPSSGSAGVCTLVRRQGSPIFATFEPVVDNVVPEGPTFQYFRSNVTPSGDLAPATEADGTDIGVVRIRLEVNVDGTRQVLNTDVDLRNRG